MESSRLDVTKAIQSVKVFIEKIGKREVKNAGYENAIVSSVTLGKDIKSIRKELGDLFGSAVDYYSFDEICNKVLDKAVDLSTDWKYQFEYRFIPNIKKPNYILFTIWDSHNIIYANEIEKYKSLEKEGESIMAKKNDTKNTRKYTEEELDYMEKLYAGDGDAADKFYNEDKHKMTKKKKIKLEAQFKVKYPKFKGVNDGVIWQSFYNSRIRSRKTEVLKLNVIKDEVKQELETVETVPSGEPEFQYTVKTSHAQLSVYVAKLKAYMLSVGVGTHKSVAIDFINDVFNTGSYTNSKQTTSLAKLLRKAFNIINNDEDFMYQGKYSMCKIDKTSDDNSAKNMKLFITVDAKPEYINEPEEKVVEEEVAEPVITNLVVDDQEDVSVKDMISECIEHNVVKYKKYVVSYSVSFYAKRRFGKSKYLGVRSVQLEMIEDADITPEELDKQVRSNIEYFMASNSPDDKLEVHLEPLNGKDYNVILSKEI